jgi:hypothetical protein
MSERAPTSTILLCHADEALHTEAVARFLYARTDLRGVIRIHDSRRAFWRRVRREWKRSGTLGMLDILAFRVLYRLSIAKRDAAWHARTLAALRDRWPPLPATVSVLDVANPNSQECEAFLKERQPDAMVALCKHILAPRIFEIPRAGTYILHDGIAPEYRNAHGCFWAIANEDYDRVGLTVLRADRGIDTGPIFGYFTYRYDARHESPNVIAHRVLLDNLDGVGDLIVRAAAGAAERTAVDGRRSGIWGQPHLTSYLRMRWRLRRADARVRA